MEYISYDELCEINKKLQEMFVDKFEVGALDESLVDSVLHSVKNSVYFKIDHLPTLEDKAAHLWHMLSRYQAFYNGNKRTSIVSMLILLFINGKFINVQDEKVVDKLYDLTVHVVDKHDESDMIKFLKDNTYECNFKTPVDSTDVQLAYKTIVSYPLIKKLLAKLAKE